MLHMILYMHSLICMIYMQCNEINHAILYRLHKIYHNTLHKKWSFPLKISSVNVTKPPIWSHLLKKSLMKNFIVCAVTPVYSDPYFVVFGIFDAVINHICINLDVYFYKKNTVPYLLKYVISQWELANSVK